MVQCPSARTTFKKEETVSYGLSSDISTAHTYMHVLTRMYAHA